MDVEAAIRQYIPQVVHMSLGTSKDNKPWVCEVHFAYDDNLNLYFRSLTARRHSQEIAANSHVAGNIIKQHALGEYPRGVYFEGTATLLASKDEQKEAATYLTARLQPPGDILAESQDPTKPQFYKISVEKFYVFGKLDDQGAKKHELIWRSTNSTF